MSKHFGLEDNLTGIITGASSGIGRALAVLLAQKYKAKLILNARTEVSLLQTAALVEQAGGKAVCLVGDIAQNNLAAKIVDKCLESYGTINLLINNAGFAKPGKITSLIYEDWQAVFAVNFFAPLQSTYQALPHMIKAGKGKIVNIASIAGKVSFPGSVCYSASKFALTGMSEGMAEELSSENIDVITVCPGWVRSEFFSKAQMSDDNNPTKIANQANGVGWLMRNFLSISSESCAQHTIRALEKGGSQEIILTAPGIIVERVNALCPSLVPKLVAKVRN